VNCALRGVPWGEREQVTLVPERGIGIAVFANKQLTVFPEAVRAAFLERELGPSGRDLQAQIRREHAAWNALVAVPKQPTNGVPLTRGLDAFTGRYASPLYGPLVVVLDGTKLKVAVGPHAYPGHLAHWSGDTFLLFFDNPADPPGLLTFDFAGSVAAAREIIGTKVPGASVMTNYGHFGRSQ
jgi:hypothetical protein